MPQYQFRANARHNIISLFVARKMDGEGGITCLFNANVKINEHRRLESIRMLERDQDLNETAAAIYDVLDDEWCYPKWADPKGIKVPPRAFIILSQGIINACRDGALVIAGDRNNAMAAIATGAKDYIRDMPQGYAGVITFADPPEIL